MTNEHQHTNPKPLSGGRSRILFFFGLGIVFALTGLLSLLIGRYPIEPLTVLRILADLPFNRVAEHGDNPWIVVNLMRLPRVLMVAISGMGLSMAGAAMQGVFRNPLIGPEILGVSSGASFGGVLAMSLGFSALSMIIPLAFAFGCGALLIGFSLASLARQNTIIGLVLAGIIISGFFSALTGIVTYIADPETKLPGIVYWLMGSFARASFDSLAFLAAVSIMGMVPLLGLSWRINLLSLGESDAKSLGLNTTLLRWTIVILVSLIVAAQVSVSGGVGWVGLVIPHLARMMVGPDHSRLLPASALLGGIYLLLMDDLARTLNDYEVPIGLLTSLVGTPVFAFFFIKLKGKGWSND